MSIVDDSYDINKPYFQNHSYIEWLESFTIDERIDSDRRPTYNLLLKKLWMMPFYAIFGNDIDRATDGLNLRIQYSYILTKKSGVFDSFDITQMFGDCRVLEMLVALSMRIYDIMLDDHEYNSVSRWFWEIISSIGLDYLTDDYYQESNGDYVVEDKIDDLVNRNGDSKAPGGWFFIEDWKEKEIWYQMHEYLNQYY